LLPRFTMLGKDRILYVAWLERTTNNEMESFAKPRNAGHGARTFICCDIHCSKTIQGQPF
jgi:hypothetical protein